MADWQTLPIMALELTARNKPKQLKLKQFGRRTDANYVRESELGLHHFAIACINYTCRLDFNLVCVGRLKHIISVH